MKYYCNGSYIAEPSNEQITSDESFNFNGKVEKIKYFNTTIKMHLFIIAVKKALRKRKTKNNE